MKIKHALIALATTIALSTHAQAAIEIDENDFGPTYSTTAADIVVGKPLQLAAAVAGTALHVVGLPFSIASNSVDSSAEVLVRQPWENMRRCLGCSPAYDNYIKNQHNPQNETRFTVDGPSEIIINTDQAVVIGPR